MNIPSMTAFLVLSLCPMSHAALAQEDIPAESFPVTTRAPEEGGVEPAIPDTSREDGPRSDPGPLPELSPEDPGSPQPSEPLPDSPLSLEEPAENFERPGPGESLLALPANPSTPPALVREEPNTGMVQADFGLGQTPLLNREQGRALMTDPDFVPPKTTDI